MPFLYMMLFAVFFSVPLGALAWLLSAILHGSSRFSRWYQADMRYRAGWLALWLALVRPLLLTVYYLTLLRVPATNASVGFAYLTFPFLLPEIGTGLALEFLFPLPKGVYSGNSIPHLFAAFGIVFCALYVLWYWLLNRVNQSLSQYDL